MTRKMAALLVILCTSFISANVMAQSNEELAKKLANPVASLISVPLQSNLDQNAGLWKEPNTL